MGEFDGKTCQMRIDNMRPELGLCGKPVTTAYDMSLKGAGGLFPGDRVARIYLCEKHRPVEKAE